jgi:thiol-disulfide isomerase/thioredoxin
MQIKVIDSFESFEEYLNKYEYIIVNISAIWCKPCIAIKPMMEKYISVINEKEFIYLKIDNSVYETDDRFDDIFHMKKIPYFGMIIKKELIESIVSGDFNIVSKKIYNFVKDNKKNDINIIDDFDNNEDF